VVGIITGEENARPNYAKITFSYEDEANQTFMLPVNNVASGQTFISSVVAEDNYNIGDSETSTAVGGQVQKASWLSPTLNVINGVALSGISDNAYKIKEPNKYTDRFGKVKSVQIDLCNYNISHENYNDDNLSLIEQLPKYDSKMESDIEYKLSYVAQDVNKDSREVLKFNMCLSAITNSDRLIVSSTIFNPKETDNGDPVEFRVVLLSEEVNKFSKSRVNQKYIAISSNTINIQYTGLRLIDFNIGSATYSEEINWDNVKAIAVVYDINTFNGYINAQYLVAKNLTGLTAYQKQRTAIYAYKNSKPNWKINNQD
jgi:hypothetical protein